MKRFRALLCFSASSRRSSAFRGGPSGSSWAFLLLFIALLIAAFVHVENERLRVRIPYLYQGDEVHYLLTLNSVLRDGDVELGNNYARVSLGQLDAGSYGAGQVLEHHTYLRSFAGKAYKQTRLFEAAPEELDRDAAGRSRPRAKFIPEDGLLLDEYSWHPSYPLYLLAPVLSLLPSGAVEPAVIGLLVALTFLAASRFRELCLFLAPSTLYADLSMLAVFVGTPVLFYSRHLYPETIFIAMVVLACHAWVIQRRGLAPALYLMLAAALKPPAALLAVPILLLVFSQDERKAAAMFALVCLGAGFSFFELRVLKGVLQAGTVVDAERLFDTTNLAYMPYANLFDPRYGLIRFAPVLLLAPPGWILLARQFPKETGVLAAGVALNFGFLCLMSFFGASYAGRYQVPFIPLLGLGFMGLWHAQGALRRVLLLAFAASLVVSVAINLDGTLWAT